MSEELVGYFGFGSLVNRHTLRTDFVGMVPAQLKGWKRHWQARTEVIDRDVALLSIHEDPVSSIKGMIVIDRMANLPLVDEREVGYDRHQLSSDDIEILGPILSENPDVELPSALYVYVARKPFETSQGGSRTSRVSGRIWQTLWRKKTPTAGARPHRLTPLCAAGCRYW